MKSTIWTTDLEVEKFQYFYEINYRDPWSRGGKVEKISLKRTGPSVAEGS